VNKAGGAGFQVTAYTQTWSDIEARIGNAAKAGQIAGNFNTLIMLRVNGYLEIVVESQSRDRTIHIKKMLEPDSGICRI